MSRRRKLCAFCVVARWLFLVGVKVLACCHRVGFNTGLRTLSACRCLHGGKRGPVFVGCHSPGSIRHVGYNLRADTRTSYRVRFISGCVPLRAPCYVATRRLGTVVDRCGVRTVVVKSSTMVRRRPLHTEVGTNGEGPFCVTRASVSGAFPGTF